MANEISLSVRLRAVKSGVTLLDFNPGSKSFDMAGTRAEGGRIQDIGTSAEAISIGSDIGTEGYAYFQNLDATNYLEIGEDNSGFRPMAKLKPGQIAVFPLAIAAPYARANTATCKLLYGVSEE